MRFSVRQETRPKASDARQTNNEVRERALALDQTEAEDNAADEVFGRVQLITCP